MTIVHIIPSFTGGGAERFVVSLCNTLSDNNKNKVHIISLFPINKTMFLHNNLDTRVTLHFLEKKLGLDFKIFFTLYKLIKKLNPDVVNTHVRAFNYNYLNLLFNNTPKYYHTVHNTAINECPSQFNRKLRKIFFKKKVKPITISKQCSKSFQSIYRLQNDIIINNGRESIKPSNKFNDIENEIKTYKFNKETLIFINVANLLNTKGHINLVKAFHNFVIEKKVNAVLLIIGDRRQGDQEIYTTIQQYSSKNIKYLGKKTNVEDYLLCSDVFILSSSIEGMPISIIEAMSSGCIPIVTPVGGVIDMVKHLKNGLIANSYSKSDLNKILNFYVSLEQDKVSYLKKNSIQTFEDKYKIERTASKYLELYTN